MRTGLKIILSCLLFLLMTAFFTYSDLQESNAKVKDIATSKIPADLKQESKPEKSQKTEKIVVKKDKNRQTTPTPTGKATQGTPESHTADITVSTHDLKAVGGTVTTTETTNISSHSTQTIDDATLPVQQNMAPQIPPQSPVPPQTNEADRAAAVQAAKDAWATQTDQTSNTPTNGNIVVNTSSNTVSPANGAYSTNQVITSPGNSATLNTAGEVKIITGPAD